MMRCTNILVPQMNGSWESCSLCWSQLNFPRQRLVRTNATNAVRLKQNTNFITLPSSKLFFSTIAGLGTRFFLTCPMAANPRSAGGHSTFRP